MKLSNLLFWKYKKELCWFCKNDFMFNFVPMFNKATQEELPYSLWQPCPVCNGKGFLIIKI